MNFVALRMLTASAKYFGLVFAIAFCTFLLENQTFHLPPASCDARPARSDVTDAEVLGDGSEDRILGSDQALKDTDLTRVRGVTGWRGRCALQGQPVAKSSRKVRRLGASEARRRDAVGRSAEMLLGSGSGCAEPDSMISTSWLVLLSRRAPSSGASWK